MEKQILFKLTGAYRSNSGSILQLVDDIESQIFKILPADIKDNAIIDISELDYIDSNISVILYAFIKLIINATPKNIKLWLPENEALQKLLLKNNFSLLWNDIPKDDYFDTVIRISENHTPTEAVQMLKDVVLPKLNKVFNNGYQYEFVSALAEVCYNAFSHGNARNLYICGQFFPNQHKLRITLVNFGNTFQDNVIEFWKANDNVAIDDLKFISWALIESNTTDKNSTGIGLARFMDVIKTQKAELIIISGNEVYTYLDGKSNDRWNQYLNIGGTIINITFNLNNENIENPYLEKSND